LKNIAGRAADEEREPALLLTGKVTTRELSVRCAGPGPGARAPEGHGLEPPETGVVPTGGARRQAETPPASAGARGRRHSGAERRHDGYAGRAGHIESKRRKAGGC
jgi:hypothetical protein